MALITLDQAKLHLRIDLDNTEYDDNLEEIVEDASGIILDYLKVESTMWQSSSGEPDDVPGPIKSATKLAVSALFENPEGLDSGPVPLSETVKNLVHRYRDPAMS